MDIIRWNTLTQNSTVPSRAQGASKLHYFPSQTFLIIYTNELTKRELSVSVSESKQQEQEKRRTTNDLVLRKRQHDELKVTARNGDVT